MELRAQGYTRGWERSLCDLAPCRGGTCMNMLLDEGLPHSPVGHVNSFGSQSEIKPIIDF